jgi:FtsH-binding integral membrane protein
MSCFYDPYVKFIQQNTWLMVLCLVVNITVFYALIYVRSVARKVPTNFLLLLVFTLTEAYMVSAITSQYDPSSVFIAAILTAGIVVSLSVYACTTKTDFTVCGGLLFTAVMTLFIAGIFSFFFRNRILQIIISSLSVLVFSVYLVYDTQLILGNHSLKLQIDDYIFAAMNLYLDIIRIFIEILRIIGTARN